MSPLVSVSAGLRFVEVDRNAALVPPPDNETSVLAPFPLIPPSEVDARVIFPGVADAGGAMIRSIDAQSRAAKPASPRILPSPPKSASEARRVFPMCQSPQSKVLLNRTLP